MARQTSSFLALAVGCTAASVFSVLAEPADTLLAGPEVRLAQSPAGLIQKNIDGTMRPPEVPIAEAALELMELDRVTAGKVEVLLAERAAVMDAIVKENLDTLNAMRSERKAGGREGRREHMLKISEIFEPVLKDGPLADQIAGLMPAAQREEYLGLLDEHREMMRAERRARGPRGGKRGAGPGGEGRGFGPGPGPGVPPEDQMLFEDEMISPPGAGAGRGPGRQGQRDGDFGKRGRRDGARGQRDGQFGAQFAQMQTLRIEIRRSVERVTGERVDRMAEIVSALNLTPEQEAKVRAILRDGAKKAKNAVVDRRTARRETMRALAEELTDEQREQLREFMGGPGPRGNARGPGRRQRGPDSDD